MSDDDKKLLRDIHACLIGDKLNGKPGLVDVVEMQHREVYGDEATGHEGLKPKVERLEDSSKRTRYMVTGVIGVAAAFVTIYGCWDYIVAIFK